MLILTATLFTGCTPLLTHHHYPSQLKGIVIGEGEFQTYLDIAFLREDVIGKNQLLLTQEGRKNWTLRTKIREGAEVMVGDQIIQPTLDEEGYAEMTDREVVIRW